MFIPTEKLKQYFWSIFGAIGIIAFWAGVWEGIGGLPYLENAGVSLVVGLVLLTFSGLFYKQFDPLGEVEKSVHKTLHFVHRHPQKEEFHIKYHDRMRKKEIILNLGELRNIEKGFLVLVEKGKKESFIPIHRVTHISHREKTLWKV
ncbi:MAG: RNA repair domain-containing protein [Nanoarchaeota archaeon]